MSLVLKNLGMFIFSIINTIFFSCFAYIAFLLVLVALPLLAVLFSVKRHYKNRKDKSRSLQVAFFHPYCNAGGGGERVLWYAIEAIADKYPYAKISVYTGDIDASPKKISQKVHQQFDIKLPENLNFVYLHKRSWIEASKYPYFTLLGQSIGSMILACEALKNHVPDICVDTMGYAFTYPIFSFMGGCKVISYTHYPTITSDMINKVISRSSSYNNQNFIARNPFFTFVKLIYYRIFALLYRFVGKFADIIMVNSSWTENHIHSLWRRQMITYKVYPPCDTDALQRIPLHRTITGKIKIVSVAQFRPEKNHPLQMKTMYHLRQLVSEQMWENLELVVIGSTRNQEDENWVQDMKDLAKHLSIENNVTFKVNISYNDLKKELEEGE